MNLFKYLFKYFVYGRYIGFYIGIFVYIILAKKITIIFTNYTTIISILLLIPFIIDEITQYFELRERNNILSLITGLLGGIGLMIILKTLYFLTVPI